jgi:hypothetical protein
MDASPQAARDVRAGLDGIPRGNALMHAEPLNVSEKQLIWRKVEKEPA